MEIFEKKYSKYIEKLYGERRNEEEDKIQIEENLKIGLSEYKIIERMDMTHVNTYSIDPDGCEDADDAFSIYKENEKLYLAIHIADPTEYININSELWIKIKEKLITYYPSNRRPIHMIPHDIMERASLMDNNYGNIKKAITIFTEIDLINFLPKGKIKLLFTNIKVEKEKSYSYKRASIEFENISSLKYGLKISEALERERGKNALGIKLKEVNNSIIKYENGIPYLYKDSKYERKMKHMIEEFAIFANTFVGEYLRFQLDGYGIYRTCDAREIIGDDYENLNGNDILESIITKGIKADYMNKVSSHDLVGSNEYTHFTSPIRRASDCICHYLLKYLKIKSIGNRNINIPFNNEELLDLSEKCLSKTREIKKIQYTDIKFRLIQVIYNIVNKNGYANIEYYITGCMNGFVNIIINKIEEHYVYLSYSLRRNNYIEQTGNKKKYNLTIQSVNCREKFDEGSLPELDNIF
tara:strand:- start:1454 stop:2860 length:1407 start_codon:yes stop_codon:yes gene_type:complete